MKHNYLKGLIAALATAFSANSFAAGVGTGVQQAAVEKAGTVSQTSKPEEVARQAPEAPVKTLDAITVTGSGGRSGTLPTHIPATIESITGKQVEDTINAASSAAALKHFPSIHVNHNYIGDSGHGVMSSRAAGTGDSARHLVYADGILLSNLLGNDGHRGPRWEMVTPEEIERVDVLYGPFSAAHPGNSMGAVVDYVTRMPKQFEAHAKTSGFTQDYKQYGTNDRYSGHQMNASLGNKHGGWSWRINVNRLDNNSHPIWFANQPISATVGSAGVPVTGAVADKDTKNQDRLIFGATSQTHTLQDHAKVKLAYEFSPTVRASYTLGWWRNAVTGSSDTYLRDAAGNPVYSGSVNIDGRQYTLPATAISLRRTNLDHVIHGLSVKSNTQGLWDWDVTASLYDYASDQARSPTIARPVASTGGAGRITDQEGSGWNTLALKGIWRPHFHGGHIVDMGYQRESYKLRTEVSNTTDWINGGASSRFSAFNGNTELHSLYAQDTWGFAPAWKTTLGGRLEQWRAFGGERASATTTVPFGEREETYFSPKAGIAFQAAPQWALKASLGRAVRMPTVAELYQGTINHNNVITNNNPDLKPEKAWVSEFTAERDLGNGLLRATLFHNDARDALYSQPNMMMGTPVTNVQNVEHVRTTGLELAFQANDLGLRGLDLSSSLTYANSETVKNNNFPDSVGKWQPLVPQWRTNLLAAYRANTQWTTTFGARYSGKQYRTLDNSDINGATLGGVSSFFITDLRVRYQATRQWSAALGIDNLNNARVWAGHSSAQRTIIAELKFDL